MHSTFSTHETQQPASPLAWGLRKLGWWICWTFCQTNKPITKKIVDMGLIDALLGIISDTDGRLIAPSSPAVLASLCVLLSLSTHQHYAALIAEKPLRIFVSLAQGYRSLLGNACARYSDR